MKWIVRRTLELIGWSFIGSPPETAKYIIVGFPHTSNWDFLLFLGVLSHWDLEVRFLAKAPLFRQPLGWFMRRWGGIPVALSGSTALVDAATSAFANHEEMVLVLAPEGTRDRVDAWKSGFWRIGDAADVPICVVSVDGAGKQLEFGVCRKIEGNPEEWMRSAAEFLAGKDGLKPANRGEVRL